MIRTVVAGLLGLLLVVTSVVAAAATPDMDDQVAELAALLPADADQRVEAMGARLHVDTSWQEALQQVINPADYQCEATDLAQWLAALVARTDAATLATLNQFAVTQWALYYTALFDDDPRDDVFGFDGQHTRELQRRHRDAQRFWDVPTADVRLHGMHGRDLADDAKMVPTVQALFGVPTPTAQAIVDFVQSRIEAEPTVGYDHPLFTFNAVAIDTQPIAGVGTIPDQVILGDGVLLSLEELGLGDHGPDYVHAHEFAHHVQFELGAFDSPLPPPEATRRTELMADGFAAYHMAHARGGSFQARRIVDVVRGAFNVGDCAFSNAGHHGTPRQREAAATWGADMAQSARPQGLITPATVMLGRFEHQLPILVGPDA